MATSGSKVKLRRTAVRRQRSEHSVSLLKRLRQRVGIVQVLVGLGFVVVAAAITLYGQDPFPFYQGQEVREPIYSRVRFTIVDEKGTQEAKKVAREGTPNHYKLNEELVTRIRAAVMQLYSTAKKYESYDDYLEAKAQAGDGAAAADRWNLDEPAYAVLRGFSQAEEPDQFKALLDKLVDQLKRRRLVRTGDHKGRGEGDESVHVILQGALPNKSDLPLETGTDLKVEDDAMDSFSDSNLKTVNFAAGALSKIFPGPLRERIELMLKGMLKDEPLFRFDLKRTRDAMNREESSREEVLFSLYPHEPLATAEITVPGEGGSDEQPDLVSLPFFLTTQQVTLLRHEHDRFMELRSGPLAELEPQDVDLAETLRRQHRFQQVGMGALIVLVAMGLAVYCSMFERRVIENPVRALSIAVLFLLMMGVARTLYLSDVAVRYPFIVVGNVIITAAILTMVYSQRFAIGMTVGLALLITLAVRGDLPMMLALTASMGVAIYQLREIRSRHELISTGLLNAMAAFIAVLVAVLVDGYRLETALRQAGLAGMVAFVAIAIFFITLPPVERIFKVATNWTLLELLDTSRPLLSRLAREAPGTFAHSLWVSNMAEAACEAIGANPLLAKVGAMYHDIGKVHKAEYFTENQVAQINRHDKLSPTMSLLVIVGHVKDGVELAKEERLPPAIIRFIQEHHGTTVVRYFHHMATELQKAAGNTREVSDTEFRYPGPKPQSRETAVLMLCDGVEGAVRALQEPTAGRIENVVHRVLMDRLNDGQFDACEITLKDLHKVEDSLVKSLCRFYHGRVAYPKAPTAREAEPKADMANIG